MADDKISNDSGNVFNKAYAAKLYEYSNDHTSEDYDELLAKYNNMLKEITGKIPGWMPYICLDPITALSVLNRGYSWDLRFKICAGLNKIFGEFAQIPNSLTSIPVANNQNTAFIYGSKKPDSDPDGKLEEKYRKSADRVWKGFRVLVEYSRGKADDDAFVKAFEDLMDIKGCGLPRLTMALYWIDSEFYLSLDKYNREHLKQLGIPFDWKKRHDGRYYLTYLKDFKQYLDDQKQSMFDFSSSSWANQNKPEKDDPWWPDTAEYDPGFTADEWVDYLKDNKIFDKNSLRLLCQLEKMNGSATCAELADRFGGNHTTYSSIAFHLGERISKKTGCDYPDEKNGKYWPIVFQGRIVKNRLGTYEYRIRSELAEAMKHVPEIFRNIDLKTSPEEQMNLPDCPLNVIFYGPPGTGKTYNTAHRAVEIITGKDLDDPFEEYNRLCASGRICFVTFHQSYSYEEFIEGIRPVPPEDHSEGLSYEVRDGVFKRFCNSARNSWSDKPPKMNDDPQVWKVSLKGTGDNPIRTDCLNNGHIRIGWHEYGDDVTDETDYSAHGGKIVLNSFINRMKIGDLVLSCYSENTVDAIGVVTGDYRYDKSGGDYPRFRDVEWIRKFDDPVDIRKINNGKTMTLASVYKLNVLVPDVLALAGYDQSGADDKRYVIIIDEINRGNIARIFGELITLLEPSKREGNKEGLSAILPYSGDTFSVPKNVYIIGTMNTADKSLVSLDAALRRRFVFEEMMPNYDLLSDDVEGVDLQELVKAINERIEVLYDRDHVIGHSYLMKVDSLEALNSAFKDSIIPLLQEYFLDDFEKIGQVLSLSGKASESAFVSEKKYHQQFQNIPKHKYTMNEGPFDKEDFISLYPQTPE